MLHELQHLLQQFSSKTRFSHVGGSCWKAAANAIRCYIRFI